MMNKELVDPKDLIIGKLKLELEKKNKIIEQFKNYDKNRKEYYSDLALRVGELESYIAEIESEGDSLVKLREKIRRQSKEICILQSKVALTKYSVEDIELASILNKIKLKEELDELRKKIKSNKDTINTLLGTLNKYREKYGEL